VLCVSTDKTLPRGEMRRQISRGYAQERRDRRQSDVSPVLEVDAVNATAAVHAAFCITAIAYQELITKDGDDVKVENPLAHIHASHSSRPPALAVLTSPLTVCPSLSSLHRFSHDDCHCSGRGHSPSVPSSSLLLLLFHYLATPCCCLLPTPGLPSFRLPARPPSTRHLHPHHLPQCVGSAGLGGAELTI